MPSDSKDLPGELPYGDEIRSIILYNDAPRTVRKLFDLHESERRLVSCRRGCLCAHSKRVAAMFFSSSTNLPSHVLSLAQPRRSSRQEDPCFTISRTFRAQNKYIAGVDVPWEWRLREPVLERAFGIFERRRGTGASLRDLKRRSITWIVNPPGRWTHSRPFAACHNENFNTLTRLGRSLCTMPKGIASMWWRIPTPYVRYFLTVIAASLIPQIRNIE